MDALSQCIRFDGRAHRWDHFPWTQEAALGAKLKYFFHTDRPAKPEPQSVYLIYDNWNDWFYWVTQFNVYYVSELGELHSLGSVKIDRERMVPEDEKTGEENFKTNAPELPEKFDNLSDDFFSVGQSENYYESVRALPPQIAGEILSDLRDCAYDLSIFEHFQNHPAMRKSLLRDIGERHLRERLHELAVGNTELSQFDFSYLFPQPDPFDSEVRLTFSVRPLMIPPTNVHAIIGRNGVGKTTLFKGLIQGVLKKSDSDEPVGKLETPDGNEGWLSNKEYFTALSLVSYSPFDRFGPMRLTLLPEGVKYSYIGLMKFRDEKGEELTPKSFDELFSDFMRSMESCLQGIMRDRWHACLEILESDPLFKEAGIASLSSASERDFIDKSKWQVEVRRLLRRLSSGHLIILLIVTRLIEVTEERSLTLIDEPEAHLHPPLISAFIRAVSYLMSERNGVAVVATHSPVVLQEIPASSVWLLNRTGRFLSGARPEGETFGENVGQLTREIFSHELLNTGFYRMISDAVSEADSFEDVDQKFNKQLGGEARALARSMVRQKSKP